MMNARWEYEVMEKVTWRAPYQSPGPSHGRAAHEISAFTSLPIKWQKFVAEKPHSGADRTENFT